MDVLHYDVGWTNQFFKFSFEDGTVHYLPQGQIYMFNSDTQFINVGAYIRIDWNLNDNLSASSVVDLMDKIVALKTS